VRLKVNVEYVSRAKALPAKDTIVRWARAALDGAKRERTELGVRIVDEAEITELNRRFRRKRGPTDVLSFPFEDPPGVRTAMLGDVVICAPLVQRQARAQGKQPRAHWAHMLVHGIMHLRGFDHQTRLQADLMEDIERRVLRHLGFPDPYADKGHAERRR
jgi:probable rRNA maturation factor